MRKCTIFFFVAVVAVVVISGCGGSDKKSTSTGNNNTGTTNASSGDSDYAKLVDKASKARFRVTYQSSSAGSSAETLFTLSQDGSGKTAYFSDDGDTQVIADGDKYTSCSNVKTNPECTQFSGTSGSALVSVYTRLLAVPTAAIAAAKSGSGFGNTSSETIAGREATCASIDYSGLGWKACADTETGILLKWEASAGGTSGAFVASEAGEPKDSDFVPPATPGTVPSVSVPGYTIPGP